MHEFHLMRQVVRLVEETLRESGAAGADLVRVAVRPGHHPWNDTAMRTAFVAASQGTLAEGAALEILQVPGACSSCGVPRGSGETAGICPACGCADPLALGGPEIRLQDIVVRS